MSQTAKKAKSGNESYYRIHDGIKYDRALLEKAEGFAKDGQISYPEATSLWESAKDGEMVTACEKETLKYTLENFKYTDKAKNFLEAQLNPTPEHVSYYKIIDGKKYDRQLLETAEGWSSEGAISHQQAKQLWEDAKDGKGITERENFTLQYCLAKLEFSEKARNWLESQLPLTPEPKASPKAAPQASPKAAPKASPKVVPKASPQLAPTSPMASPKAAPAEDPDKVMKDPQAKVVAECEEAVKKAKNAAKQTAEQKAKAEKAAATAAKEFLKVEKADNTSKRKIAPSEVAAAERANEAYNETGKVLEKIRALFKVTEMKKEEAAMAVAKAAGEPSQACKEAMEAKTKAEYSAKEAKEEDSKAKALLADAEATLAQQKSKAIATPSAKSRGSGKGLYKTVNGVRYDRETLDAVEAASAAADGNISLSQAQSFFEGGKAISKVKELTLEHCLKTYKFSDEAAELVRGKVGV